MILALDVFYDEPADRALSAGVVFSPWTATEPTQTQTLTVQGVAPYQPGKFYRRELPCLIPLVERVLESHVIVTVVVDGYVDLGERGAGLGRHLYRAFDEAFEVVGIAKSRFAGSVDLAVLRGESKRPLWVTSTGDIEVAADHVRSMAGMYRMPTMLGLVDRLTRG